MYTEGRFETDKAVLIFDTLRLTAGSFIQETEFSPLIEVTIPALRGPDHGKHWVGVLRELSRVGYFN